MGKKLSLGLLMLASSLIICLDACVLVPFIDSYKEMGVTQSDRQALLPKTLKKFQDFIYWGQYANALSFATEESAEQIRESLKEYRNFKIVSMSAQDILFSDSSREATAYIVVKYYKIPNYIVVDENVKETWVFSNTSWKLKERVKVSE